MVFVRIMQTRHLRKVRRAPFITFPLTITHNVTFQTIASRTIAQIRSKPSKRSSGSSEFARRWGPHRSYVELLVGSRRSRKRQVAFALTMIFSKQQPPERSHKSEASPQKGGVVPRSLRGARVRIGAMWSSSSGPEDPVSGKLCLLSQ